MHKICNYDELIIMVAFMAKPADYCNQRTLF